MIICSNFDQILKNQVCERMRQFAHKILVRVVYQFILLSKSSCKVRIFVPFCSVMLIQDIIKHAVIEIRFDLGNLMTKKGKGTQKLIMKDTCQANGAIKDVQSIVCKHTIAAAKHRKNKSPGVVLEK